MDPRWEIIFNNRKHFPFEDVRKILEESNFKKTFKIINVVGTNGKGSLSNYLAEGLNSNGFKVGVFTSPHIVSPNERIKIDGKEITDEEFFVLSKDLPEGLHFFAITYIVALRWFMLNNCDFTIIEAGIGGRMDTTKAIEGDYGVVTSISLDHIDILGETVEKIAKDKSGIISRNQIFVIPSTLQDNLKDIFIDEANKNGARIIEIDNEAQTYRERNKMLAKGFLKSVFNIDINDFNGIPGRTEVFEHNGFKTIFDVGHNEDGVKESLKLLNGDYEQVVVAFKDSKDASNIEKLIGNKKIFFYKVNEQFQSFKEFEEIKNLKEFYRTQNKSTLYIGSFYLIGELWKIKNNLHD